MKLLLPIILVLLLVGGYFALKQAPNPTYNPPLISSPSPKQDLKTFSSTLMKFNVDIPNSHRVEEKMGSVVIFTNDGEIYIDRNGTNFPDLESYLNDLSQKNKFSLATKKNITINGLSASSVVTGEEMTYFIYKVNVVYTLSTKTTKLHPDLDQIAQSFRYTP